MRRHVYRPPCLKRKRGRPEKTPQVMTLERTSEFLEDLIKTAIPYHATGVLHRYAVIRISGIAQCEEDANKSQSVDSAIPISFEWKAYPVLLEKVIRVALNFAESLRSISTVSILVHENRGREGNFPVEERYGVVSYPVEPNGIQPQEVVCV